MKSLNKLQQTHERKREIGTKNARNSKRGGGNRINGRVVKNREKKKMGRGGREKRLFKTVQLNTRFRYLTVGVASRSRSWFLKSPYFPRVIGRTRRKWIVSNNKKKGERKKWKIINRPVKRRAISLPINSVSDLFTFFCQLDSPQLWEGWRDVLLSRGENSPVVGRG